MDGGFRCGRSAPQVLLELRWGLVAQRGMQSFPIIPRVDERHQRAVQRTVRSEVLVAEQFPFQRGKETLRRGVISTSPTPTHADDPAVRREAGPIVVARVLAAAIRMVQQAPRRLAHRQKARCRAVRGKAVSSEALVAHPTTRREARSSTTADEVQ